MVSSPASHPPICSARQLTLFTNSAGDSLPGHQRMRIQGQGHSKWHQCYGCDIRLGLSLTLQAQASILGLILLRRGQTLFTTCLQPALGSRMCSVREFHCQTSTSIDGHLSKIKESPQAMLTMLFGLGPSHEHGPTHWSICPLDRKLITPGC